MKARDGKGWGGLIELLMLALAWMTGRLRLCRRWFAALLLLPGLCAAGLQDRKQEQLIAGLIFSGGVIGTSFNYATTRLPVLVLHHERDQCVSTTPENAVKTYEKLKEGGNTKAELAMLKTGPATRESHDVCAAGNHMFQGAMVEGAQAIDLFIGENLTPG